MPDPSPSAAEALADSARLLSYALEQTTTIEEAFRRLHDASDPRQRAVVQQLESLLRPAESGAPAGDWPQLSCYSTLAWLLRESTASERSAAAFFCEFRHAQVINATATAAVKSEFSGFLAYLGGVLGVLVVVLGMYGLYVLPQFNALYGGFGRQLPALTAFVFGRGAPIFALALLLAIGLFTFFWRFLHRLRARLRRYEPMPGRYYPFPLVGQITRAYNEYLWLSYAALLRAGGLSAEDSLRVAGTRLPPVSIQSSDPALSNTPAAARSENAEMDANLTSAARLGKLEQEMRFQQQVSVEEFLAALKRGRRRTRIILSFLIYYLVATFVAAMYLPIFSLGSTI